jgi:hypothetical protein
MIATTYMTGPADEAENALDRGSKTLLCSLSLCGVDVWWPCR